MVPFAYLVRGLHFHYVVVSTFGLLLFLFPVVMHGIFMVPLTLLISWGLLSTPLPGVCAVSTLVRRRRKREEEEGEGYCDIEIWGKINGKEKNNKR